MAKEDLMLKRSFNSANRLGLFVIEGMLQNGASLNRKILYSRLKDVNTIEAIEIRTAESSATRTVVEQTQAAKFDRLSSRLKD